MTHRMKLFAVPAIVALGAGSLGDERDHVDAASETEDTVEAVPEPTGEPILIGMYVQTESTSGNAPEMIEGTQAAVDYVNQDLGGVNNRPLELEVCDTNGSVEALTACANELIQAEPLFVIGGPETEGPSGLAVFEAAGVPVIGGAVFSPVELSSPIRTVFSGFSSAVVPGQVYFAAAELGAEQIVFLAPAGGFAEPVMNFLVAPVAAALGLPEVQVVEVPQSAADYTPAVSSALDLEADAMISVGLRCGPLIEAAKTIADDIPLILTGDCSDAATLEAVGDAAEGVYFIHQFYSPQTSPDNEDVQVFQYATERYAGDVAVTDFSLAGFAAIMNMYDVLSGLPADAELTPSAVGDAVRRQVEAPNFLADTYTCDPPAHPFFVAVCNGNAFLVEHTGEGLELLTPVGVPVIDYLGSPGQ